MTVYALVGGSFDFLGVIIVRFFAVGYGYYTYREARSTSIPATGWMGAPRSAGPSQASGKGRTSEDNPDESAPAVASQRTERTDRRPGIPDWRVAAIRRSLKSFARLIQ